jgi:hypothetical protein
MLSLFFLLAKLCIYFNFADLKNCQNEEDASDRSVDRAGGTPTT